MESLCLPKINTKMPTNTKSVEMSKFVSNLEIYLHHCLCESRGFKIVRSNHWMCSVKKVFLKTLQSLQRSTFVRVRQGYSTVSFTKILRTLFYRRLPGDCFWWRGLMVKSFNSVYLNFLNSQLYHALPEWWLLFWCNEEHFLIKKTWLYFK